MEMRISVMQSLFSTADTAISAVFWLCVIYTVEQLPNCLVTVSVGVSNVLFIAKELKLSFKT